MSDMGKEDVKLTAKPMKTVFPKVLDHDENLVGGDVGEGRCRWCSTARYGVDEAESSTSLQWETTQGAGEVGQHLALDVMDAVPSKRLD